MALHHKLCHTMGGLFDLPHAETHTVILPHATAYNAVGAARSWLRCPRPWGRCTRAALWDFAKRLGAPMSLRELGMPEEGIAEGRRTGRRQPLLEPPSDRAGPGGGPDPRRLVGGAAT
jgi:maleylacetate reductase